MKLKPQCRWAARPGCKATAAQKHSSFEKARVLWLWDLEAQILGFTVAGAGPPSMGKDENIAR